MHIPRFVVGLILIVGLGLTACSSYVESEVYFRDLEEMAEEDLNARLKLHVPLPSRDSCSEYRERYDRVWAQSSDFAALEYVQCHQEGYDTYVEYAMDIPLQACCGEVREEDIALSGPAAIVVFDLLQDDQYALLLVVDPTSLNRLDALVYEEFYMPLDLEDSAVRIIFINDTREDQVLVVEHVFVHDQPVPYPATLVLEPRDSIEVVLSDVVSAWIFTPAVEEELREALLGFWSPVPEGGTETATGNNGG